MATFNKFWRYRTDAKNSISAPSYYCQKQTGRPDCAYVKVNGKRVMLGNYGFPDSYEKYAEAISGNRPKAPDDKKVNPNKADKPKAVQRTVGSNMKSEPIDPSMLENVREILRARRFEGYQKAR
ncbi:hypothetical protein [Aeoliella sp.]|uniref:hypothetical protein n=1 Tax=Aeoliella sp. TaxID=2795800 RepID=UPI003CCBC7D7